MKNKIISLSLVCILIILTTPFVYGDDWYSQHGTYFTVYDIETNEVLFKTGREVTEGDQYLSGDNRRYEVTRVDQGRSEAFAEFKEEVTLPKVNKVALEQVRLALREEGGLTAFLLAQEEGNGDEGEEEARRVGIYATHTAESYVPTDGQESIEEGGGILKVAERLSNGFGNFGVESIFDDTNHIPQDAGAYKRSRRTALQLLTEQGASSLIDVHRDAIPAEEYNTEIEGQDASKVRLVVGRRNQNFQANEELATHVKAVADEMYPGLIKDIFYAKGDYNQDLTPRAMLLEMGTYENERERAEISADYFAEVATTALFGGVVEDAETGVQEETAGVEESDEGSGSGIMWIVGIVVLGGLAFLFLSTGGKEWKSKVSNFKQEFANLLGRRKK
ncbi:MAG: stage II sporulation protein P [Clostridiaceae bacterium]|nr:stage II sporulation protein P [Clostridiaceae bacterium]